MARDRTDSIISREGPHKRHHTIDPSPLSFPPRLPLNNRELTAQARSAPLRTVSANYIAVAQLANSEFSETVLRTRPLSFSLCTSAFNTLACFPNLYTYTRRLRKNCWRRNGSGAREFWQRSQSNRAEHFALSAECRAWRLSGASQRCAAGSGW